MEGCKVQVKIPVTLQRDVNYRILEAQELEAETNRSVGSSAASTARQGAPDELKVMLGGLLGKDPKDSYAAWLGFK